MARINTNVSSLIARSNLNRANDDLTVRLQRLSTGLKINRGADNPAGLIISERLRSEISGINQAVDNSQRASSVIATTEGALSEVADLLNSITALVVEAANTGAISDQERQANQLQIDSAIESITRIANSTSFGGLKLLNGELDYVLSGVSTDEITKAQVNGINFAGQPSVQINVEVIASAQTANLYLSASTGEFLSTTTIEIAGPLGVQTLEILSSTPLSAVVAAVNRLTEATGITASLINPADQTSGMVFSSADYGTGSFVSAKRLQGPAGGGWFQTMKMDADSQLPTTFSFSNSSLLSQMSASNRDTGRDVDAIVNGARANGDGLRLFLQNANSLSLDLLLAESTGTAAGSTTSFHVTGGGALYQLGGQVNSSQQTNIGVQSVAASRLGGTLINGELSFLSSLKSGGTNDLRSRNFSNASDILTSASDEVSLIRGRLGAFEKNTLDTNVRSLQIAVENLTASESRIRDADFAAETSALTRSQILTSAGTSVLALSNSQAQQVLQLLG